MLFGRIFYLYSVMTLRIYHPVSFWDFSYVFGNDFLSVFSNDYNIIPSRIFLGFFSCFCLS